MRYFQTESARVQIGLAYGPSGLRFLDRHPELVDYVEIPFELLRHDPSAARVQENVPTVLHCASLSMAGFVAPDDRTVEAIAAEGQRMGTPWIGEHLAFLTADAPDDDPAGQPTTLTYTVCPQLSEQTADRTIANVQALSERLPAPLLLENSPQYFFVPGSTMGMADFMGRVLAHCDAGLLLDLTHFLITMRNLGGDPRAALERLPLERAVEIHLSGITTQAGLAWDDHANAAPEEVFELLALTLRRARPRAVTFEYNWGMNVPDTLLERQIRRVRELCA